MLLNTIPTINNTKKMILINITKIIVIKEDNKDLQVSLEIIRLLILIR